MIIPGLNTDGMSCVFQFLKGCKKPLKRLMTYSASAHGLFGLGKLEPGKEWVKKRDSFLEMKGDSGDQSEDEYQEMPCPAFLASNTQER